MNVCDLPEYCLVDDSVIGRFTKELSSVKTVDELKTFINRWRPLWELGDEDKDPSVKEVDNKIAAVEVTEEDLECIRLLFTKNSPGCSHIKERLCVGAEIRMPHTLCCAFLAAHKYQVPTMTAMHQLYCNDESHERCF